MSQELIFLKKNFKRTEVNVEYKFSKYNINFEYNHCIYVFNTYSNSLCSFEKSEYKKIFEDGVFDSNELNNLYNQGFIVNSSINEFNKIQFDQNYYKFNNSHTLHIVFAPTASCNLKCNYCFQENNKINFQKKLTKENILNFIISSVKKLNIKKLKIQWFGGEPMLEFSMICDLSKEILDYCDKNNIEYYSTMISNGTLINEAKLIDLIGCGIKKIQITLDGCENTYCKYKNATSIQYKHLLNILPIISNYINLSLRLNCDRKNYDDIKRLCRNELKDVISKKNTFAYLGRIERSISDPYFKDCYSVEEFNSIKLDFHNFLTSLGVESTQIPIKKKLYCGFKSLFCFGIDRQGYIYNCEREIGNVEKSVGHIESGLNFTDEYLNFVLNSLIQEECIKCVYYPMCLGGCPQNIINKKKDCQITYDLLISKLKNKIDLLNN